MEVSFTTHSHIIGRAGTNINTVMKETSTKIHFPDENRVAGEKKSNEVTISGELVNVETARRRIRVRIGLFLSTFFCRYFRFAYPAVTFLRFFVCVCVPAVSDSDRVCC